MHQGVGNFPHGIDLLTKADYFTLASISHAYLDVSRHIAQYAEYRYVLVDHLASVKLFHWDVNVRVLAASALGQLAPLDVAYMLSAIVPPLLVASISPSSDVIVRHGATLALSEIALHIASVPAFIDGEVMRRLKLIPIEMDKRRLYRGRGGEMIRVAVCTLMQTIAKLGWPLPIALAKKYLITVEECLKNPNELVRTVAIAAFQELATRYLAKLLDSPDHALYMQAIVPRFLSSVKDKSVLNPNVAARRGFLKALGVMPYVLLHPHVHQCVDLMVVAAVASYHTPDEQDAESRVAAIQALVDIVTKNHHEMTVDMLTRVLESLLKCADEDYSMDERGDVGSWVRREAMQGLHVIVQHYCAVGTRTGGDMYNQRVAVTGFGTGVIVETRALKRKMVSVQFAKPALGYFYFPPNGVGIFPDNRALHVPTPRGLPSLEARHVVTSSTHSTTPSSSVVGVPPAIVSKHAKDDRVVVPLLKTIAFCLDEGAFAFLLQDGGALFGHALYDAVRGEMAKSSDLHKLSAGLAVLVGLLPSEVSVEKRSLRGICVRKLAAEKLYTRLILHEDVVDQAKV
ncbi:hypothetical protein DYB31_005102 [Aphanomyces astaci]|uniref:Tubulin-folding cofactor D C-terminal domain-containing protein n=1 Tax=Aphanomyces astaci TaxID=112090 RepID=A0A397FHD3_APHAT|nr:hypothetical protein DYB31_005102 [Aphanomyces astaci]